MNPDNKLKTPAGYNGRTSSVAYDLGFEFATRGLIRGWVVSPGAGLSVKISSPADSRSMAIAADDKEKAGLYMDQGQSVQIALQSLTTSAVHALVAIIKARPTGTPANPDNPESVSIFDVPSAQKMTDAEIEQYVKSSTTIGDFQGGKWVRIADVETGASATEPGAITPGANAETGLPFSTKKTASGDYIELHDAAELKFLSYRIDGNTSQDGIPTPDAPVELVSDNIETVQNTGINIYAGHKGDFYHLSAPIELRSIGETRDSIEKRDGVWGINRRTGKKTYLEDEILPQAVYSYKNVSYAIIIKPEECASYLNYDPILSLYSSAEYTSANGDYDNIKYIDKINSTADNRYFWIGFVKDTTLEQMKQKLKNSVLIYRLKHTTFEPLPAEDQAIFESLQGFIPETIVATQGRQTLEYIPATLQPIIDSLNNKEVDDFMSDDSTNAVQNKTIKSYVDSKVYPAPGVKKLVIFGDSWSDPEVTDSIWGNIAGEAMNLDVKNYAKNGAGFTLDSNTIDEEIDRFLADNTYNKKDIKHVVFLGGINDYLFGNRSVDPLMRAIFACIERVKEAAPNANILYVNDFKYPYSLEQSKFWINLHEILTSKICIKTYNPDGTFGSALMNTSNYFHLTQPGQQLLARNIVAALEGGELIGYQDKWEFQNNGNLAKIRTRRIGSVISAQVMIKNGNSVQASGLIDIKVPDSGIKIPYGDYKWDGSFPLVGKVSYSFNEVIMDISENEIKVIPKDGLSADTRTYFDFQMIIPS